MQANSITIVVAFKDGYFFGSAPGHRPVGHPFGPREGALAFANEIWGRGEHNAVCSEVHGDKLSATFILTREEVAHAA